MTRDPAGDGIDITRPAIARVYDFILGGSHNFAADRQAAREILAADPALRQAAYANRAFLRRVVSYCVAQGIDRFLDIGSGSPTVGNVHEVAQRLDPRARAVYVYVYVDVDAVAVTHTRRILAGYRDALAKGSFLAVSHGTEDGQSDPHADGLRTYRRTVVEWRPAPEEAPSPGVYFYGGVGRRR